MTGQGKGNENEKLLVNDVEEKLPPMRAGVEMIPVNHEERELIYFHDPQGYMVKPFVLDKQIAALLPMLNGRYSVRDINEELKRYGNQVDENHLLGFMRQLDDARLLLSPWFHQYKNQIEESFEFAGKRPPVCSGQSYPSDKTELGNMLRAAFTTNGNTTDDNSGIKALYAPHIDPRIGLNAYIPAFQPLAGLKPTRIVLLATSHYAGMYHPIYDGKPFIATRKNFETPFGVVPTDQKAIDLLERNAAQTGCSLQDRAHRNEHSIELHLIFLQYLWTHSFELVPILVGSLEEMYYKKDGDIGNKVDAMASLLGRHYGDDENTLFIISGDLAHIGKKFGDDEPAASLFEEVKAFDQEFLESAGKGDSEALLEIMKKEYDPYRICGFPPLYTALSALPDVKGSVTSYELWDEEERESAVTYGSLLYQRVP